MTAVSPVSEPLTLDSLRRQALDIEKCLTTDQQDRAIALLGALYQQGVACIRGEVLDHPVIDGFVTPVIFTLDELVSNPKLERLDAVHRALSKAYRVFLELAWYKLCRVFHATPDWAMMMKISSKEAIAGQRLDQETHVHREEFRTRFEYASAMQVAKCLHPFYAQLGAKPTSSNTATKTFHAVHALITNFATNRVLGWYLPTQELRWRITTVIHRADYVALQANLLRHYTEEGLAKGGYRAQGLVLSLLDVLENPEADADLKQLVIRGESDHTLGLMHIATWERVGFLETPAANFCHSIDRHYGARCLLFEALKALVAAHRVSQDVFNELCQLRNTQITGRSNLERLQVQATVEKEILTATLEQKRAQRISLSAQYGALKHSPQKEKMPHPNEVATLKQQALSLAKQESELGAQINMLTQDLQILAAPSPEILTTLQEMENREKALLVPM